ncbi:CheR family methyltransferase [Ferrimonas lipolytica]|uniref:protein-glutamate O-methyltransferase n=1 Tax=Ferrimonas lipolytica TaxID=2724191 RepID=A0A6H1UG04_9GAMM|nr:protein-glutamate O-methyltransferase CheR [Ferrimonas lipolytica]QIZ77253.1 protein-glutamate O-methyltransferase CheR [Ferrimonas lipolytica]
MPNKTLAPNEYRAFAEFLNKKSGIELGDNKQYLVRSRLAPLLVKYRCNTMAELVKQVLASDAPALHTEVVEAMTTNETFWFRDGYPFELFKEQLLPELAKQKRRPRVWSAACSTGQEPYSLAMALQEFRQRNPGKLTLPPEIIATDLDTKVLSQAQTGSYDSLAMARGLSPERSRQFFDSQPDGKHQVNQATRSLVSFRRLNLFDSYALLGKFDVIYCRNVLIYFSADSKRQILRQFAAALNPGGYLMLGASESMAQLSDEFEMLRFPSGIVYRKR